MRIDPTYFLVEGSPRFLNPRLVLLLRIEVFLRRNPNFFSARQIGGKLIFRPHSAAAAGVSSRYIHG
jgi:hypothetical protein